MFKQVILIIALSLMAIFFRVEISHLLNALVYLHNQVSHLLHLIFSDDVTGRVIQNVIALLIIPFVFGLIVGIVFWLIKRATMPHIMAIVWGFWLVLLVTLLAQTGSITSKATVNRMASHAHTTWGITQT
jgi:hypothetical protein